MSSASAVLRAGMAGTFEGTPNGIMPCSRCEPPSTMAYQSRCASGGMYLRFGTPPFSTQRPSPSNFGEWQSVQLWESASASPLLTCAAVNVCLGGRGTSGIWIFGIGNGCLPPSLNARSREGPYLDVGVTIMVEVYHDLNPPPPPTG